MISETKIRKLEKAVSEISGPNMKTLHVRTAACENQVLLSRKISRDAAGNPFLEILDWGPQADLISGLEPIEEIHAQAMEKLQDYESEFHCANYTGGHPSNTVGYEPYRLKLMGYESV